MTAVFSEHNIVYTNPDNYQDTSMRALVPTMMNSPPGPRRKIRGVLSRETKDIIRADLEKAYVRGARESISERDMWQNVSDFAETSSKVLAGVTSILSFASGTYKSATLSFIAGSVGVTGVTLAGFSVYASRESRERLLRLNAILHDIHVDPVTPDAQDQPTVKDEDS